MTLFFSADLANDLNVELSRVVCELESALERQTLPLGVRDGSAHEARTADCLQQTSEVGTVDASSTCELQKVHAQEKRP